MTVWKYLLITGSNFWESFLIRKEPVPYFGLGFRVEGAKPYTLYLDPPPTLY